MWSAVNYGLEETGKLQSEQMPVKITAYENYEIKTKAVLEDGISLKDISIWI